MNTEQAARIEAAVAEAEMTSDAEIIVVYADRSGSYRDLAAAGATVVCGAVLALILLLPHEFSWYGALVELAITWLVAAWVLDRTGLAVRVAGAARRARQVEDAAHAEFSREAVHATPHRTGILIYMSRLEGALTLMPDQGVLGCIAPGALAEARAALGGATVDTLPAALGALSRTLALALPPREVDLVNLPNAPRIRR